MARCLDRAHCLSCNARSICDPAGLKDMMDSGDGGGGDRAFRGWERGGRGSSILSSMIRPWQQVHHWDNSDLSCSGSTHTSVQSWCKLCDSWKAYWEFMVMLFVMKTNVSFHQGNHFRH